MSDFESLENIQKTWVTLEAEKLDQISQTRPYLSHAVEAMKLRLLDDPEGYLVAKLWDEQDACDRSRILEEELN